MCKRRGCVDPDNQRPWCPICPAERGHLPPGESSLALHIARHHTTVFPPAPGPVG